MHTKQAISGLCLFILLTGCTPKATALAPTALPATANEARESLIKFFELLNSKQYADADLFYGGDYEQLKIFSPDTSPSDHTKLWADACQLAGLQCLNVRNVTLKNQLNDRYVFQVEFNRSDGSLFVQGLCCGGSDEIQPPPVFQFEYHVTRNTNGKFLVMELPPYVP